MPDSENEYRKMKALLVKTTMAHSAIIGITASEETILAEYARKLIDHPEDTIDAVREIFTDYNLSYTDQEITELLNRMTSEQPSLAATRSQYLASNVPIILSIYSIRKELGLTQMEFATNVGITRQTMFNLENNRTQLSRHTAEKIIAVYPQYRDTLQALLSEQQESPPPSVTTATEEPHMGTKIRELRHERGVSLRQMAEMTGIHFTTLSKYEKHGLIPDAKLVIILERLGLTRLDLEASSASAKPNHNTVVGVIGGGSVVASIISDLPPATMPSDLQPVVSNSHLPKPPSIPRSH